MGRAHEATHARLPKHTCIAADGGTANSSGSLGSIHVSNLLQMENVSIGNNDPGTRLDVSNYLDIVHWQCRYDLRAVAF